MKLHEGITRDGLSKRICLTGPIGKTLEIINKIKRVLSFDPIPGLEPLIEIPDEVVKKMSTDSSQCYKLLCAL